MHQHPDQSVDPPANSNTSLVFLLLVALFLAGVTYLRFRQKTEFSLEGTQQLGVGNKLEPFEIEPLLNTEKSFHLEDIHGKVALINYWGPWCGPCMMELPELLELEKEYRHNDRVAMLLVASDGGAKQPLEEFKVETQQALWDNKSDSPIYHDPSGKMKSAVVRTARLAQFGFPTTIMVNPQGMIVGVWQGYRPYYVKEMQILLQQTLATEPTK